MHHVVLFLFFLMIRRPPRSTPFPTTTLCRSRRRFPSRPGGVGGARDPIRSQGVLVGRATRPAAGPAPDRKSTRLNSSHANISYAVFCLKKKKHLADILL